jgi:hypothetical protein
MQEPVNEQIGEDNMSQTKYFISGTNLHGTSMQITFFSLPVKEQMAENNINQTKQGISRTNFIGTRMHIIFLQFTIKRDGLGYCLATSMLVR